MLIAALSAGWTALLLIAWRLCRAAAKAESSYVIAASADPPLGGDRTSRFTRPDRG